MKLKAPRTVVFWIAVVALIVAILMEVGVLNIDIISSFWVAVVAFAILALGDVIKNF